MSRSFESRTWLAMIRPDFRRLALLAMVILATASHRSAFAQVDSPAAQDARAAIRALYKSHGAKPDWARWTRQLNLDDVEYELRAGDCAEPGPLAAAAEQIHGQRAKENGAKEFATPDFVRLATDLETRAAELADVAPSQWAAECRRRADDYAPVTPEAIEGAKATLKTRLDALERRLPAVRTKDSEWAKFLFWPETLELLTAEKHDGATLDRLETRWRGMLSVWEVSESIEASLAVQSTIRLIRAYQAAETKEAHAAAWNALAALAERSPPADPAELAAAVKGANGSLSRRP